MDNANGVISYILGPGLIPQLLLTVVAILVLYSVITVVETIVNAIQRLDRQTTVLFPDTANSRQLVPQERSGDYPLIYNSENEVNGMEFSYSMYLFISPDTFESTVATACKGKKDQDATRLKHIFHKGSKDSFPLLAPGLFCDGSKNTLRLYMNSTTAWDNYVEIPNVPIGKWFHLVIIQKGKYLDVYVNGNVTVRHQFDTVPKLNYGHVYMLYPITFPKSAGDRKLSIPFTVDGPIKGMVSRVKYYAYALNYSQIDGLYREGPSKVIVSNSFSEQPPYFHDDWWVTKY
jgi:hypothetical protein